MDMEKSRKKSCRSRSTAGTAMHMVISKNLWWTVLFLVSGRSTPFLVLAGSRGP